MADAPRLLEALGWTVADGGELEADDVMFSYAGSSPGRRRALCSPATVTYTRRSGARGDPRARPQRPREPDRSGGGASALRRGARAGGRLHRAARGSLGRPAGAPGIGAKTAGALLRRYGSLEGAIAAAGGVRDADMSARIAAALEDNAELLRTFGASPRSSAWPSSARPIARPITRAAPRSRASSGWPRSPSASPSVERRRRSRSGVVTENALGDQRGLLGVLHLDRRLDLRLEASGTSETSTSSAPPRHCAPTGSGAGNARGRGRS